MVEGGEHRDWIRRRHVTQPLELAFGFSRDGHGKPGRAEHEETGRSRACEEWLRAVGSQAVSCGRKRDSWETGDYSKQKAYLNPREREGTELMSAPLGTGARGQRGARVGFPWGLSLLQPGCVLAGRIQRGKWGSEGERGCLEGSMAVAPRNRPGGRMRRGVQEGCHGSSRGPPGAPVFSEGGGQPLAQRADGGPGVESPLRRERGERVRSSKGLLEVRV